MSTFRVSSQELKNKATQLENLNKQFKTAVENLKTNEQSLATMWEGDAQKEFRNAFNKDTAQFNEFYNGIAQYVQELRKAAEQYATAESKNLSIATTRK